MDKLPVGQLPDLQQSNNDDEIMVITNSEYNQLKKEKISDLITDFTSTNENNALTKGTDGKLFVTDFGNASNITEGTLPVSVLPDIPKDKLPEIETDDLPDSGITAGTYTYPTDIVVNSKGQVTSITEGQAGTNNANQDLSNLGPLGLDKINQSKALETGSVSSDADVYADIQKYAHSTFDLSKFEVVGSPVITDDGIASDFSNSNYIKKTISLKNNYIIKGSFTIGEVNKINIPFAMSTNNQLLVSFRVDSSNSRMVLVAKNTSGSNTTKFSSVNSIKTGDKIDFVIVANGSNLILNSNKLNLEMTDFDNQETDYITFGVDRGFTSPFSGTIDLKSIAVWGDGVSVFNGNKTGTDTINDIEIPYTESKTGSKIVDVAYRDRVQSLYEQTGEALFYTIDEQNQNFTLPAGDIYGMIERAGTTRASDSASPSDKTETWTLKASLQTYEAPADGWFYISGVGSSTIQGLVHMRCESTNLRYEAPCSNSLGVNLSIPVKKGDIVQISYANYTNYNFGFTYTKGALND